MLNYNIINNGKTKWILFLHCIAVDGKIFKYQEEAYSKRFNILYIDLPGHGESTNYPKDFSAKTIVQEVEKILDMLKISKINILSLSLGAIISHYICVIIPERVEKIVMAGQLIRFKPKIFLYGFHVLSKVKKALPRNIYLFFIVFIILPFKKSKEDRTIFLKCCKKMDKHYLYNWLDVMDKYFYELEWLLPLVLDSKVKKLYVMGHRDIVFKDAVIQYIPCNDYNEVYIMKDAGHLCNKDNPRVFNKITLQFLGKEM